MEINFKKILFLVIHKKSSMNNKSGKTHTKNLNIMFSKSVQYYLDKINSIADWPLITLPRAVFWYHSITMSV